MKTNLYYKNFELSLAFIMRCTACPIILFAQKSGGREGGDGLHERSSLFLERKPMGGSKCSACFF